MLTQSTTPLQVGFSSPLVSLYEQILSSTQAKGLDAISHHTGTQFIFQFEGLSGCFVIQSSLKYILSPSLSKCVCTGCTCAHMHVKDRRQSQVLLFRHQAPFF